MAAQNSPSPEAMTLEELEDFLSSEHAPVECMSLSELDGFLTGAAIGPETIPPDEWWPIIWREADPQFHDRVMAQAAVGAIMNRYDEIVREADDEAVAPILWKSGEVIIADEWADGFADAIALRKHRWDMMAKTNAVQLLMPLLILWDAGEILETKTDEERFEAIQEAAEVLPEAVMALAMYWRMPASQRKSFVAGFIGEAHPGRNDPCPCGSGKKFKKCCGAAN